MGQPLGGVFGEVPAHVHQGHADALLEHFGHVEADVVAPEDHHPFQEGSGAPGSQLRHRFDAVRGADDEHLVPRLDAVRAGWHDRLVAAADGHNPAGAPLRTGAQRGERGPGQYAVIADEHARHGDRPADQRGHLRGAGGLEQAQDFPRGLLVGVDDLVDAQFAQRHVGVVRGEGWVADAGDGQPATELAGQEAGEDVHLVTVAGGHEDVRHGHSRLTQIAGRGAGTRDHLTVQLLARRRGSDGVDLHHRHVVVFLGQNAGQGLPDAAATVNHDLHRAVTDTATG